jgi:alanyl-tRNA synthetase
MRAAALIAVGDAVHTAVDSAEWREEIRRHHTSAHLLQRALKDVLGDESCKPVPGSASTGCGSISAVPGGALSPQQKRAVAERVNELIRDDYHQEMDELPIEEAHRRPGAISMAGEKYGDRVRVVESFRARRSSSAAARTRIRRANSDCS